MTTVSQACSKRDTERNGPLRKGRNGDWTSQLVLTNTQATLWERRFAWDPRRPASRVGSPSMPERGPDRETSWRRGFLN